MYDFMTSDKQTKNNLCDNWSIYSGLCLHYIPVLIDDMKQQEANKQYVSSCSILKTKNHLQGFKIL